MTREEHWKIVDAVIDAHNDNEMGGKYAKAFNHGVQSAFNRVCKALKDIEQQQQPCEDCISREAVLDVIDFEDEWLFDAKSHNADTKIAFSTIKSKISKMSYVTPQRPRGKWIETLEHRDEFGSTWHYECSECRAKSYKGFEPLEKYCPNCGAEMSGGGENEEEDE